MSNQTPKNCISESAFLSPPTSTFKPLSSNQTPFWMTAPNFETISPFDSPYRSNNSTLSISSSSSSYNSPIRLRRRKKDQPIHIFKWIILILSVFLASLSTQKLDLILPATCLFVAFVVIQCTEYYHEYHH